MDAFEKNKIAGAVLSALLLTVSINVFTNTFFEKRGTHVIGYDLPAEEGIATSTKGTAAEPALPLPVLLAKADPSKGEKALGKCKACHSFEKGGPNRVGPNLYGIINHLMGAAVGFNYSSAIKEKNAEKTLWTFEAIDAFLTNPKAYIKGTNMAFAGISKAEERADIIAYLRTLSDSPVPLPAAPALAETPPTPNVSKAPESSVPATASPKASTTSAPVPAAPSAAPASKTPGGASPLTTTPSAPSAASPKAPTAPPAPSAAAPASKAPGGTSPPVTTPSAPAAASPKAS